MTSQTAAVGTILGLRYCLDNPLDPGGSGDVVLCRDLRNNRARVVVRFLSNGQSEGVATPLLRQHFSSLSRLQHPNLARLLDLGVVEKTGSHFLVEEYVDGSDLIRASEGWQIDQMMRALVRIARVLQFLHLRGIAHGSLKPSHVLASGQQHDPDRIKVVGLGLKPVSSGGTRPFGAGSIAYSAPEILLGQPASPRADIYSLGILAYHLLARRLPFEEGHEGYLVQKHLQGRADMRPIERLECGPGLAQALKALLEKEPEQRPSTAEDVIRLLSVATGRDLSSGASEAPESYFSSGPFVSREREMEILRKRLSRVRETGRGWTVFISGESGAGKSRCMEEFRLWAQLEGWRVIEGSCLPHEGRPYEPYREILEGSAPADALDGEIFRFAESPKGAPSDSLNLMAESAAGQFRDLLTRELVRRLGGSPTILMLHDFHWADQATTAVLDYLSSDILAHPILVCVSLRQGEADRAPVGALIEKASRQERSELLSLEPLSEKAVGELIAGMAGDKDLGAETAPKIHSATGGNPFFVEEILKHLVDRGVLTKDAKGWHLEQEGFNRLEVPDSVALVLRRRLETLSSSARVLARWIALFNHAVSEDLLLSAIAGNPRTMRESLAELLDKQILRERRVEEGGRLEFRHAIISEVIRTDLPKSDRRKMHRSIGEALEQLNPPEASLQELATHFMQGTESDKAVAYALDAASACRAEFAHESALKFYEYALNHGDSISQETLCQAGIEAAEVCCAMGLAKRAVRMLEDLLKRGNSLPRQSKARIYAHLAISYQHLGNFRFVAKFAKIGLRLLSKLDNSEDGVTKAILLKQLSFCELITSHPKKGLLLLSQSLQAIAEQPNGVLAGHIHTTIAAMHWVACDFHAASDSSKKALAILEEHRALHLLPIAYSHLGACMGVLGRLKSSLSLHERAVEISRRSRGIALRAQALGNQAEALCRSGHLKEARDVAETAFNLMKDSGNSVIKYGLTATIAEIGITIGDYAAAHRALDQLREYANKNLAQYSRGHARYLSAWLSYEMGNNEDCLCNLDRLRRIESAEAPFYQRELAEILRAKIFLRRGFGEKSIKILQNLDRIVVKKRLPFQMCMTRLALAGSFIDSGSPHRANKPIRDALRLAKAMPSSHLEADAHLFLARMHKLNARSVSSITAPRTVSSPSVHRALEVTRSELLEALRLAKLSEAREQLWRIHAELAAAEEANADAPAALYQAKLAIKCMDELESLVPADSIDSYRKHPERVQARAECNRIIQESERTDFPTIAVRDMEEEHLRILFRISCAITSIRELESLLGTITTELIHSVGVERALVFLEEDGKGRLHLAKGLDRNGQFTVEADALNREVLDEVFRSRAPFVSANAQADPRLAGGGPPSDQTRGTVFCVPLVSGGRSLGVIYADHPHPSLLPAESTFNFLAAFSNLAASAIDNALVHDRLMQEKIELEHHLRQAREGFREIVGESDVMMRLRERIALAAASPLDVLIIGESGTGKELVARALHRMGRRASGNFITVDCGSLADTLAESEFFGYRKGSFTGAVENRAGLLEAAHGGVIFLDEISNLTIKLQGKLLRVLQEREVRRIGETAPRKIDLQVFAATNRNLKTEVDRGRFRKDLYYRLDQMQIRVAPLRERIEDVPLLAAVFLERESQAERVRAKSFCREALDVLSRYSFPGNVRELRNAVRSAHYSCPGSIIRVEHLPAEIRETDEDSVGQEERSARLLYDRIRKGRGNFNDHVKEPFLKRQIARQTVRHLLSLALSSTGGWYRDALRQLRVPSKEYSPTLVFLKRHDCYLDFRPYRRRTGGDAGNSTGKQGRRVEDR